MSSQLLASETIQNQTSVYRAILDNLPDGTFLLDEQHRIIDVNRTAVSIANLPVDKILNEHISQILTNKIDLFLRDMAAGNSPNEIVLGRDDKKRPYIVQFKPLAGATDAPLYLLTLRDIGAQKAAERDLRAQKELFANMVSVARITARDVGLHQVLQNAVDIAITITNAQWGSLLMVNDDLTLKDSILSRSEVSTTKREEIIHQVLSKGVASWVLEHCHPVLIHDAEQDARWLQLTDQPYIVRSVLSVPIMGDTEVIGVLTLQHSEQHHFTAEDAGLLQAAADQIALVVHNAHMYETQRRLARQQAILHSTLRTISGQRNPYKVVHSAVETIQKLTGWTAVSLFLLTDAGNHFIIRAGSERLAHMEGDMIDIRFGVYGRSFQQESTIIETINAEENCPLTSNSDFQNGIATPLNYREHKFGVLAAYGEDGVFFSHHDTWLIEALAEAIALAITNARLFNSIIGEQGRLRALIQANRDGIILVGMDRRILVINEHALEFLHLEKPAAAWVNQPLRRGLEAIKSVEPQVFETFINEVKRTQRGNESIGEGEVQTKDRIIYWMTTPVMVDDKPIGRLMVMRDVSQERQIERLREDLIQTTVHDLRNPLGAAFAATEFLDEMVAAQLDEEAMQLIELARRSTGKALNLVNTILDINQLESGRMPIKFTLLRLQKVVQEVVDVHLALAKAKKIEIFIDIPSQLPFVWADATLIDRVLQNLLGNALKFTLTDGEIRIQAGVEQMNTKQLIFVSVSDTGTGVPQEVRQNVFEKFTTGALNGHHGKTQRGSGLGLAFCKMALEAHGQDIWLEESSTNGTTFTFTLATEPSD